MTALLDGGTMAECRCALVVGDTTFCWFSEESSITGFVLKTEDIGSIRSIVKGEMTSALQRGLARWMELRGDHLRGITPCESL